MNCIIVHPPIPQSEKLGAKKTQHSTMQSALAVELSNIYNKIASVYGQWSRVSCMTDPFSIHVQYDRYICAQNWMHLNYMLIKRGSARHAE